MVGDPVDVLHGLLHVVEENLPDPGPPPRHFGAPLSQPTVVGSKTGKAPLVVGRGGRGGHEAARREEGRDRVRVDDLAHDAVRLERRLAHAAIPVSVGVGRREIPEGAHVPFEPSIERLVPPLFKVWAVVSEVGSCMAIRRDDGITVHRLVFLSVRWAPHLTSSAGPSNARPLSAGLRCGASVGQGGCVAGPKLWSRSDDTSTSTVRGCGTWLTWPRRTFEACGRRCALCRHRSGRRHVHGRRGAAARRRRPSRPHHLRQLAGPRRRLMIGARRLTSLIGEGTGEAEEFLSGPGHTKTR